MTRAIQIASPHLGCWTFVLLPHEVLVAHSAALVEDLAVVLQPLAEDEALRREKAVCIQLPHKVHGRGVSASARKS